MRELYSTVILPNEGAGLGGPLLIQVVETTSDARDNPNSDIVCPNSDKLFIIITSTHAHWEYVG